MKNKILALALVSVVFFSCKKTEETVVEDNSKPEVEEVATKECYEYVQGNDTIQANLLVQSNDVSGEFIGSSNAPRKWECQIMLFRTALSEYPNCQFLLIFVHH